LKFVWNILVVLLIVAHRGIVADLSRESIGFETAFA